MSEVDSNGKGLSRRGLLGQAYRMALGACVAAIEIPIDVGLVEGTSKLTGHPAGNASIEEKAHQKCSGKTDPDKCLEDYQLSPKEQLMGVTIDPLIEEMYFRGVPSMMLDAHQSRGEKDYTPTKWGTGGYKLSRKEVGVGLVTSLIFGAAHNLTNRGFDTSNIPISQTFGGFVLWTLQRKAGFMSNLSEHATFNLIVLKAS